MILTTSGDTGASTRRHEKFWGIPKESLDMAKITMQETIDTGADILLTSCVFCKYNFLDAVNDMNARIEILNTEDLVVDLMEPTSPLSPCK